MTLRRNEVDGNGNERGKHEYFIEVGLWGEWKERLQTLFGKNAL